MKPSPTSLIATFADSNHRSSRAAEALAWSLAALAALGALGGLGLVTAAGNWSRLLREGHADAPVVAIVGGIFGALIVRQRPRNPIGWLVLINALAQGLHILDQQLSHVGGGSGGDVAAGLAPATLVLAAATLCLELLLFPDGRPLSGGWRVLVYATVADLVFGLGVVGWSMWTAQGAASLEGQAGPASTVGTLNNIGRLVIASIAALGVVGLVLRYRRSEGAERQQVKWYAYGNGLTVVLVVVAHLLRGPAGNLIAAGSPVPALASLYIAIRRYRLYQIDRIVSRTVAYGLLTVVLAAVYLMSATLLAWALATVGGGSTLVAAGSAVCAAAAFQPARRWLQEIGDRAFRRRSYEAERVVSRYLGTLQESPLEARALRTAITEALQDPDADVGLWLGSAGRYVDEEGGVLDPPEEGGGIAVSRVDRGGEHLGVVFHNRALAEADPDLLTTTLRCLAAAMDHARLRAQIAIQLQDVRASRARIVTAGDLQRRRLERDLHDGAQQRLLAAAITLRRLEAKSARNAEEGAGPSGESLGAAAAEIEGAMVEIRRLARGLAPAVLTEQGLVSAVSGLADVAPFPVSVDARLHERFPPDLETTIYYVVAEALTNVAKHAQAHHVEVILGRDDGRLVVQVADDGIGGALVEGGFGLMGLSDRVEAAGGTFEVRSLRSHGTTVRATVPLG